VCKSKSHVRTCVNKGHSRLAARWDARTAMDAFGNAVCTIWADNKKALQGFPMRCSGTLVVISPGLIHLF
jgi:hypothetical protein